MIKAGRVVMLLPRRLRSLNRRGGFWSEFGDRQAWKKLVSEATKTDDGTFALPVTERVRIEFLRLAPSKRYLLDKENLESSGKRLTDSLVELGYAVDDKREWADGPWLSQGISDDKCYWTIVTLAFAEPFVASANEKVSPQEEAKRRLLL